MWILSALSRQGLSMRMLAVVYTPLSYHFCIKLDWSLACAVYLCRDSTSALPVPLQQQLLVQAQPRSPLLQWQRQQQCTSLALDLCPTFSSDPPGATGGRCTCQHSRSSTSMVGGAGPCMCLLCVVWHPPISTYLLIQKYWYGSLHGRCLVGIAACPLHCEGLAAYTYVIASTCCGRTRGGKTHV
jgi:hypothetical protein